MAATGKKSIHYTKRDLDTSKSIALGFKNIKFYHEPTEGDTVIDLTSLAFPSSGTPAGAANPSVTELSEANLLFNRNSFILISSLSGVLDFDSYEFTSNTKITLAEGTLEGELFTGVIYNTPRTGLQVLDGIPGVTTATLLAGADEVVTNTSFARNANPGSQIGAVMVLMDGQLLLRNSGNATAAPGADGNYEEVGTGASASSIKFNTTYGTDREIIILPTPQFTVAPNDTVLGLIEKVAGENNKIIPTVAALAGVAESTFTSAPSAVDGSNFGQRVIDLETYTVISSTATLTGTVNRVLADMTGGPFTINAPLNPSVGDWFEIWDSEGLFGTNTLTVGRNGENIDGAAADFTISTDNVRVKLVYASASRGWIIGDMT